MQTKLALTGAVLMAASATAGAQSYEIWAIDQGTATVHIYNDKLEEAAKLDLSAAWRARAAHGRFHPGRRLRADRRDGLGQRLGRAHQGPAGRGGARRPGRPAMPPRCAPTGGKRSSP